MDEKKRAGELAAELINVRVRAAENLLGIIEEGNGQLDDGVGFLENLSKRQAVIDEMLTLQDRLGEIRQRADFAGALPEDAESEARADGAVRRAYELSKKNIDEVGRHLEMYKTAMARLKAKKSGMAAYCKNSGLSENRCFEVHG